MSSGVVPHDDCKPAFDKVRLGKVKYVTYKIDDKAEKTEVCAIGETKVKAFDVCVCCFLRRVHRACARRLRFAREGRELRDARSLLTFWNALTPKRLFSSHHHPLRARARKQAEFKFEKFLSLLPETESRYAVLDWDVSTDDGRQFSKLFFISWVPDSCKAKEKMLYASSKQSLRNALSGVHLDHQAADMDDVTEEIFTMKALGK